MGWTHQKALKAWVVDWLFKKSSGLFPAQDTKSHGVKEASSLSFSLTQWPSLPYLFMHSLCHPGTYATMLVYLGGPTEDYTSSKGLRFHTEQKFWTLVFVLVSLKTWLDFFHGEMDGYRTLEIQRQISTWINLATTQSSVRGSVKCFSCDPVEEHNFHWQQKQYAFSRNQTSNFEFLSFPRLVKCSTIISCNAGQKQ